MRVPLPSLSVMTLSWPAVWSDVFGRERPLILEIGFGRGAFLLHLGRTHPEHNVIGLEISNRCMTHVEHQVVRLGLTHVRPVYAMAETALHHLFVPASLEQVHVNFPDPWFRTRHSHRRLMQRATLDVIVNRLAPGGAFYLATDIRDYAEMSHRLLAETPQLDNLLPSAWASALPDRIVTKYEYQARREQRDCHYFAYRRNDLPAPVVPMIEELHMPHLVFTSPITLDTVEAQFDLDSFQAADGMHIHFLRVWRSGDHLLFETHVKEPTIEQRLALTLSARADSRFTLQVSTLGHPRPTRGVHHAVNALADWLLRLHPDARIIVRKLHDQE